MSKQVTAKRMALNAVLIAIYVVLSMPFMVISVGGLKITFEHFPVVLCAVLFGPLEAMLVGGIGEFLNQVTSFGITPTTVLWILPIVARGFTVGVCKKMFKNSMNKKIPWTFWIVCIVSGILSSLLNTLALYVDSKMFGYYTFAMVFGALALRLILSVITSIVIAVVIRPILRALSHQSFIE